MSGICVVDSKFALTDESLDCLVQRGNHFSNFIIPVCESQNIFMYQLSVTVNASFLTAGIPLLWHGDLNDNDFHRLSRINSMTDNFMIAQLVNSISSPYAFVYYNSFCRKLLFGRDQFGIRCLLKLSSDKNLLISSIAVDTFNEYEEIKAGVIFALNVEDQSLEIISDDSFDSLKPLKCIPSPNDYVDYLIDALISFFRELNFHPAVMFSGGLDSAVLTRILDLVAPKDEVIDLLNTCLKEDAPDRITGKQTLAELRLLSPDRKFNFVQINPTVSDINIEREKDIASLIYPKNTVLDDSIGCVLWFSARGLGILEDGSLYQSKARIIISGLGADELLAGYARHRSIYENHGLHALQTSLVEEMERISSRNCGRDDRVAGFHRKYVYYPFLAQNISRFLFNLPVSEKIDISLSRGTGEKILLRKVAAKLGLKKACHLPKRAMQFGSKIANLDGKERGSDVCLRLCTAFNKSKHGNSSIPVS